MKKIISLILSILLLSDGVYALGFEDIIYDENYALVSVDSDGITTITQADDFNSALTLFEQEKDHYDNLGITKDGIFYKVEHGIVALHKSDACDVNVEFVNKIDGSSNYVNGCYGNDGAYLTTRDDMKVEFKISGVVGVADFADVTIIPLEFLNDTSLSIYKNIDGNLYHQIKNDVANDYYSNLINLGPSPAYLVQDVSYYSYDGHYFYEDIKTLLDDYKNDSYANSINVSEPYYNYYQFVSHRTLTNITQQQMEKYLHESLLIDDVIYSYEDMDKDSADDSLTRSQFYGSEFAFYQYQYQYGANAAMMIALAMNESAYGRSSLAFTRNNLFGHAAYDSDVERNASRYLSVPSSIYSHAKYYISGTYCYPSKFQYHGGFFGNKASGMNVSYASDPYWGEKAAQYYFGKDVGDLNTAESAMLAGIVNAPSLFNPHQHLDYATNRRNTVLSMMNYHGYITDAEYDLYSSIKVEDLLADPSKQEASGDDEYAYQSYIDYVVKEAQEVTGLDPYSVSMEIYTAMDKEAQEMMDRIQAGEEENVQFPDDLMEIGMFSMNNQTGEVVAIGGGRNYGRGGSMLLNHATDQYKQPGSSVKTILSYPLAFENLGWATSHVVVDQPIIYAGTDFVIKNANGQYVGQITLKEAVERSLNTPAISTLQDVIDKIGLDGVRSYLQSLGFSCVKNNPELVDIQYAIGGSNFIVSCEELAAAHSVMMNGGYYIQPHAITRIEFNNGNEPYEANFAKNQVVSSATAFMISDLMRYAVEGPNFNYMEVLQRNYPVYGKTGTTDWGSEGLQYNIPQGAIKDKWMVSETTMYTTAVWVGYEKGVKDADTYFSSAKSQLNIPGKISSLILSALTDDQNPAAVAQPDDVTSITHILATFPYASPIENMDPAYITTGYIQKDNATLVSPETTEINELSSFNASLSEDGTLNISWAPYPDASKLTVAPDSMDLSLSVGNTYVEAWGKRLFDYTWIYGPIRYKARIMQDGQQVQEIVSETENFSGQVALNPGSHIQVCGYYAFESMPTTSNEICSEFEMVDAEVKITVPSSDAKMVDLTNWAGPNNYKYETKQIVDNSRAGKTEVQYNGQNVSGQTISVKQSQLSSISFVFIEYIAEATPSPTPTTSPSPSPTPTCGANATAVNGVCECNSGFERRFFHDGGGHHAVLESLGTDLNGGGQKRVLVHGRHPFGKNLEMDNPYNPD